MYTFGLNDAVLAGGGVESGGGAADAGGASAAPGPASSMGLSELPPPPQEASIRLKTIGGAKAGSRIVLIKATKLYTNAAQQRVLLGTPNERIY